jgi:hypothetical protein
VSQPERAAAPSRFPALTGPTVSFGFNLERVPGQGEDADPILRDGRDLGLIGVFDGMGGAGGTVYDTPDGRRSGAYLASRLARDVVERRMLDLLEPEWNLNGRAAAEDLQRSVQKALVECLQELSPAPSALRSKLLRALPTTMALVALQREEPAGPTWAGHVFWAGDSRAYVFEPDGAHQLTTDDIRDGSDAMANLRQDSIVGNAMCADADFHVNYRKVKLRSPFILVAATDGCFGYVRTPMHFEHMFLRTLQGAGDAESWSSALQAEIEAMTGDDAAMSALAVGASFEGFKSLFEDRTDKLGKRFTAPLDQLDQEIARAEQELEALRGRREVQATKLWREYQARYERYLHDHQAPTGEEHEDDEDDDETTEVDRGHAP